MATTFDGISFGIVTTDWVKLPEQALATTVRHPPYSDRVVVHIGGKAETTYQVTIRIAYSLLTAWRARLGVTATLVIDGASYANTTLIALTNIRRTPRSEYAELDASFVVGP